MRPPSNDHVESLTMSLTTKSLLVAPLALLLTVGAASAQRGGGGRPGGGAAPGRVGGSMGGRVGAPVGGSMSGFRGPMVAPRPPAGFPVTSVRPTNPGMTNRNVFPPTSTIPSRPFEAPAHAYSSETR